MVRIASALLIAASALTLCEATLKYQVYVRNLTYLQPFSPILMFAHTEEIQGFQVGEEVSPEFRTLAEDGETSALLSLADDKDVAPFLCGFTLGEDPVAPGELQSFTLEVDDEHCKTGIFFTMASMLVNTNDAFVGIDTLPLGRKSSQILYPPAYDAGTEENNELCSHIPGPACDATSGNEQAGPGEGFVQIHRGFHGVGGELAAENYDWRNPVAEVYISRPSRS